jgi:hypothetical protein
MHTLNLILYVLAAVCFALATVGNARVNWVAAGLLAWVLVPAIRAVRTA